MLVFRDGRRRLPGPLLAGSLRHLLGAIGTAHPDPELLLTALLRAGELECALADAGSPAAVELAIITDPLAQALLRRRAPAEPASLVARLDSLNTPATLTISTPEGFAYYALHPLDYARLACDAVCSAPSLTGRRIAVLGIRSIGATLSAAAVAGLRQKGIAASRITVRPAGHPFDRHTEFTAQQRAWLDRHRAADTAFLVVDEGPGLSGSSFLSVGEALMAAGVDAHNIIFLCGRQPDLGHLRARDAAARWRQFRTAWPQHSECVPPETGEYLGAGRWRAAINLAPSSWPASWNSMERQKHRSRDRRRFYKFEGLGHYGEAAFARSRALAAAGFAPAALGRSRGFTAYEWIDGIPLAAADLTPEIVSRIAAYCAERVGCCASSGAFPDLGEMVRCNFKLEFGDELEFETPRVVRGVICDNRMAPHYWLRTPSAIMKTSASLHGDDHFYPGPTDIAWDLAGAMVEWQMPHDARQQLLADYRRLTGDDPQPRLAPYLLAYALFRMGFCKMAAEAMAGSDESARLRAACLYYRAVVEQLLPRASAFALHVASGRTPRSHPRRTAALPR